MMVPEGPKSMSGCLAGLRKYYSIPGIDVLNMALHSIHHKTTPSSPNTIISEPTWRLYGSSLRKYTSIPTKTANNPNSNPKIIPVAVCPRLGAFSGDISSSNRGAMDPLVVGGDGKVVLHSEHTPDDVQLGHISLPHCGHRHLASCFWQI